MTIQHLFYLLAMALTTYLVRMIPFTLFRKKLTSRFAKSFFAYIPYAVLTAMTIPEVFSATGNLSSAIAGVAVAVILALCKQSLIVVAIGACLATYLVGFLPFF
ncbi:MAG: AzlD domain-containing protein [Clostridia bacterium]|nr:AzlD domain-containing protein [Clostridia bacterium]